MTMGPQYQQRFSVGQFQSPQYRSKPRVLGPCFSCGGYGHLASSCGAKERPYPLCNPLYNPLCQLVVSSAADVFECMSTCVVWGGTY